MDESSDFYVFLTSNVKQHIGMQHINKIGNFYTHLPEKLYLGDDWEVGIADITYTYSWHNIPEDETIKLNFLDWTNEFNCGYESENLFGEYLLPAGNYPTISKLIEKINNVMSTSVTYNNDIKPPELTISKGDPETVCLSVGNKKFIQPNGEYYYNYIIPIFSKNLCDMLGLIDKSHQQLSTDNIGNFIKIENLSKQKSFQNWNEKNRHSYAGRDIIGLYQSQLKWIHTLYVYTDIIKPRIVGNSKSPLLRQVEVPSNASFKDDCYIKYKNRFYHPLNHHEIENIQIIFKDDIGSDIPFTFGRTTLCLHFRKRNRVLDNLLK